MDAQSGGDDEERSRQFDRKLLEILVCPITKGRWSMIRSAAS